MKVITCTDFEEVNQLFKLLFLLDSVVFYAVLVIAFLAFCLTFVLTEVSKKLEEERNEVQRLEQEKKTWLSRGVHAEFEKKDKVCFYYRISKQISLFIKCFKLM